MLIYPIKTDKITHNSITLEDLIDKYVKELKNNSILIISSKIISIVKGNLVSGSSNINDLIKSEADYIWTKPNQYGKFVTAKFNAFISAAGIDQSNGNGDFILLPKNPQQIAENIYKYLTQKNPNINFGVIICDSRSMPLRVGATGVAIGFYGFSPLKNYVGTDDIFGRAFQFEHANLVDGLATAGVLVMGEGDEQTPLAIAEDLNNFNFSPNSPTKKELEEFYVSPEKDFFHLFYSDLKNNSK